MNEIPIAPIIKINLPKELGKSIIVLIKCPFCDKEHKHGVGETIKDIATMLGKRISHCNPDKEYIIDESYKNPSFKKTYDPNYIREYHRNYYHKKIKQSS